MATFHPGSHGLPSEHSSEHVRITLLPPDGSAGRNAWATVVGEPPVLTLAGSPAVLAGVGAGYAVLVAGKRWLVAAAEGNVLTCAEA